MAEANQALAEARVGALQVPLLADPEALDRPDVGITLLPSLLAGLTLASVEDRGRAELILERLSTFGGIDGPNRTKIFGMLGFFDGPWDYFHRLGRHARELGMPAACRAFLDSALEGTSKVKDEQGRSRTIADVAEEMARAGRFRAAREAAAPCLARDKLRAYTTVLREIASARAGR
jgi:hypothetical protein